MNRFVTGFVKVTGLPIQYFYFRKKIYYEDKKHTSRKIKGGALIVSNHTSVYDYPLMMYAFFSRVIHTLVAEVIYKKSSFMNKFMNDLGAIRVDRDSYNFNFMYKMIEVLNENKVGLVFPESRLPTEKDEPGQLLDFKPSYVYVALQTGAPIIPVYTNGVYGKLKRKKKDRARIIIGKKFYINDLYDSNKTEKENIEFINGYIKNKIKTLGEQLEKVK
ncbi:MAG: 1-acyl-sn-glycerol-3-phosphate acyltransferase [Bacilli bacterium]|nr:1-acyl-sn-glycerol-3-phosphate acyltransferase [Bacilli bacterium]